MLHKSPLKILQDPNNSSEFVCLRWNWRLWSSNKISKTWSILQKYHKNTRGLLILIILKILLKFYVQYKVINDRMKKFMETETYQNRFETVRKWLANSARTFKIGTGSETVHWDLTVHFLTEKIQWKVEIWKSFEFLWENYLIQ